MANDHPEPVHLKIAQHILPVFLCPNDPAQNKGSAGAATNYLGCSGTSGLINGCDGVFCYPIQYFPTKSNGPVSNKSIRDGLSQTALIGEVLHGGQLLDGSERSRVLWQTPLSYSDTQSDFAAFRQVCESIPENPTVAGWVGDSFGLGARWTQGGIGYSTYNHSLPPFLPSCQNHYHVPSGIYTASSAHSGNVNIALADGSVRPIARTIDRSVWFEVGSRNGGVNASP